MSSIVYGPDKRTQITSGTRNVMFTVYGVPGITHEAMRRHLEDIRDNVQLVAPDAEVAAMDVYGVV
jgi:DNA/RNA-binding domain of Phe-tRNA-synthetase-like protein